MQFIKKNYEKILLGVVLAGLVAVAVSLLFMVGNEKTAQEERRNRIIAQTPKALQPPDLSRVDLSLKRVAVPQPLILADVNHKLFNPERWQKNPNSPQLIRNPTGRELEKLEVTGIHDLFFVVSVDTVNASESGTRYGVSIEQQAAARTGMRGRRTFYLGKGEKKEYGEKKETFALVEVQGPAENPTTLVLEFSDSDRQIIISREKPFRRVDGHTADLRYAPENKTFMNRRVGDKILVAGEEYTIVNITENDVVVQGKNLKKWTIKYTAVP